MVTANDSIREGAVADRGGVEPGFVNRLEWGIVAPGADGRFFPGDVRRVKLMHTLERAGVPLDRASSAVSDGVLSLDFLDGSDQPGIDYIEVGPVELKGVAEPTRLWIARHQT